MTGGLKKTVLHNLHSELGARFVDFAGYEMPLQYHSGIRAEHLHTRSKAGLFDVSHMGQIRLSGKNIERAMERLVTGDISAMKPFRQCYTLLTNLQGGIIDDLMLTRTPDYLFVVVNAACKEVDYAYLKQALGPEYQVEILQGPGLVRITGAESGNGIRCVTPRVYEFAFPGRAGD